MLTYKFNWLSFDIDITQLVSYMRTNCTNYNSMTCDDTGCTINFNTDYSDSDISLLTTYLNGLNADAQALAIAVEKVQDAITAYRDNVLYSGFTYTDGYVYDSDSVSISNIVSTLSIINAGVPIPSSFTWRTQNNSNVPYTSSQFVAFAASIFAWGEEVYIASWTAKATVAAMSTAADVLAYDVTTGWPPNNYIQ
jgi:hypothetical protein